jgi:hypothetical protein
MNMNDLRQLVERKTEAVKALEALLEKEETELVELECQLEAMESQEQNNDRQTGASPGSQADISAGLP